MNDTEWQVLWCCVMFDVCSKVLSVALISGASLTTVTLALRTLGGIMRLKVFLPEHKWGPLAHLPLAQEAMRNLLQQLTDAVSDAFDRLLSNAVCFQTHRWWQEQLTALCAVSAT